MTTNNEHTQQPAYGSPDDVVARCIAWVGRYGGENTATLLIYEAVQCIKSMKAPAPQAAPALAVPGQSKDSCGSPGTHHDIASSAAPFLGTDASQPACAALSAAPGARHATPEGWRLVPDRPSIAMCIQGAAVTDGAINGHAAGQVYATMLLMAERPDVPDAQPVAYLIDWPDDPELGHYIAEEPTDSGRCRALVLRDAAPQPAAQPFLARVQPFLARVQPWLMECFGPMIAGDREERNHRFLEEALELVQACGCTVSEAHQLVDYVFGRPVGEPAQEVGGVMVTLAALCLANDMDMHAAGEAELARIWTKVEQIRAKQAAKPKHSPLPEAAQPSGQAQPVSVPDRLSGAPDRIYLVIGDGVPADTDFSALTDVTWCADRQSDSDIEYVRAQSEGDARDVPQRACGNAGCGWTGRADRMLLGRLADLCPMCGDTLDGDVNAARAQQDGGAA